MFAFQSESSKLPQCPSGPGGLFFQSQWAKPVLAPPGTNLSGQTAIITGAASGIGFTCAGMLLDLGLSHLIITTRAQSTGDKAIEKLREQHPKASDANIEAWSLEMSSYQSIQNFASRCSSELSRIEFVILNAGIGKDVFGASESTGHEDTVQINFISTMLISILLLPVLKKTAPEGKPGRLTIVNSGTTVHAVFPQAKEPSILGAFDKPEAFDQLNYYTTSKYLAHPFIDTLSRHISPDDVVINLVDPGLTKGTDIHRNVGGIASSILATMKALGGRRLEDGASTYIDAAVLKGKETHGSFLMDWKIYPYGAPYYNEENEDAQARLWEEMMNEFEFVDAENIIQSLKP